MGYYDFNRDLDEAKIIEKKIADFLQNRGATNIEFNDDGRYDLKYEKNGETITMEIKQDQMSDTTGNVAFEVKSRKKPSGLSTTSADIWCYVLNDGYYFCETPKLRAALFAGRYTVTDGGDNKTSKIVLVPIRRFEQIFDKIDP